MNLATIQRFAPLLGFATKTSGDLTDADLSTVAVALAGEGAADMLPFLRILREKEPTQRVQEILSSDTAKKFFKQWKEEGEARANVAFCQCPGCGMRFETELA